MKRAGGWLMVVLALQLGCGGSIDKDSSAVDGGKALRTALEAWKAGKEPASLEPDIIMNELEWRNGKKLVDFKMPETSTMHGRQVRWEVDLTIQDKAGAKKDQKAKYIIDTVPRIVIVRDDLT